MLLPFLQKAQKEADLAGRISHLVNLRAKSVRPMTEQDFKNFSAPIGVPPVFLHAFFFVESSNSGFTEDGRLTINCEPHVRYRNVKGGKRKANQLYRQAPDLFYPRWINERNVPRNDFHVYRLSQIDRWDNLIRACEMDFDAAIMGTSFGAGQQLGEGYKMLGFPSPMDLVEYLYEGQHAQLDVMVRYLRVRGQLENLRSGNLRPVIASYNGEDNVPYYMAKFNSALSQKGHLYA
jgi:hypothetical protein